MRKKLLLRKFVVRLALGLCFVIGAAMFAGPVVSGAVFLLMPAAVVHPAAAVTDVYKPLHKGSVDLHTGLYIRRNEDLVVHGAPSTELGPRPPLVLRRTYLSGYRVSREFGIGTTHEGELFLVGDAARFQWIELILADGARVRFERTTPGTSFFGAMFEHRSTPGEWRGARLGWTGLNWALRRRDGSLMLFRGCSPGSPPCSIVRARDAQGHVTTYRRDGNGRLTRMEAADGRWIAFDYDVKGRISRASTSDARDARYEYDDRGRLSLVVASDGVRRAYTYTDLDQMATIREPGTDIENAFEGGRCVEQVNRYPDSDPYIFRFTYRIANGVVVQTDSDRSDGTWLRYTWGTSGYPTSETWGRDDLEPAVFTYDRDPQSSAVTGLTVTCPDRTGRPLRHSSYVQPGREDDIKWNILTTHCSWTARPGGGRAWRPE